MTFIFISNFTSVWMVCLFLSALFLLSTFSFSSFRIFLTTHMGRWRRWGKREDIAVQKADKGRGTVIMNKDKYHEKCLELLHTEQFQKLNHDPTKTTGRKVQNALCKIRWTLSIKKYKWIYLTSSSPGKFYAKIRNTF